MRALVTGGAGFLGSHLVRALLDRGAEVVVFDHRVRGKGLSDDALRRLTAIEDDIFNFDAVRHAAQGCSTIFHCAAMVGMEAYSKQPAKTMDTEEVGLRHVCRAALEGREVRVVYASSSAVYGTAGGAAGLREDLPVAPISNYGVAKRFNEVYLASQFAEHGLSSMAMRIFNMYGPGQDDRLVIPRFIRSALAGTDLAINGDGAQTRDFIYVDDVVDAMLASAEQAKGHNTINVCSGRELSIRDLAAMIVRLAGSRSNIAFRPPPAERAAFEQSRCFGSREKMQQLAGVRAAISIEDGLRRTIASIASAP